MGFFKFLAVVCVYLQVMSEFWITNIPTCSAEIRDTKIDSDSRPVILFQDFGFTHHGHLKILVTHVSFKATQAEPILMGFFLLTEESLMQLLVESEQEAHYCVLNSRFLKPLFILKQKDASMNHYNYSFPITDPSEYSLFFANCHQQYHVSMNVHTEMYNMEDDVMDFLPAGQTQLPKLYFCFSLLYLAFLGVWIYVCVKQRVAVHRIHALMCAILLLKVLNLVCEAEDKSYVNKYGTAHSWEIAFYIFGFFKGIMVFTLIVLIGAGRSFLKPYLQEREKKVLMVVIPLQVFANIAAIFIDERGPSTKDWFAWQQAYLLIDIICYCAIIFPIVGSIKTLSEASKTDGNLAKLTLFRQFYFFVVSYLYFTRIVVYALTVFTAYKFKWVSNSAEEAVCLSFYIFIFYKFQPVNKNHYFVIGDEEEEVVVALLDEDK